MKITAAQVEAMLQELYDLTPRCKMAPLPAPSIIMPGHEPPQRFRCWIMPDLATFDNGEQQCNESITYYEGTQQECSVYLARETMTIALNKVFGSVLPDGPVDSLHQTGDNPA